jgi:hypothetical protein
VGPHWVGRVESVLNPRLFPRHALPGPRSPHLPHDPKGWDSGGL